VALHALIEELELAVGLIQPKVDGFEVTIDIAEPAIDLGELSVHVTADIRTLTIHVRIMPTQLTSPILRIRQPPIASFHPARPVEPEHAPRRENIEG
jgi:hypothetical protein